MLISIDTATDSASICLSDNNEVLDFRENDFQKEHASFVHVAIESVLRNVGCSLKDVKAFAITSGPGSYTGLRVGMAAAKGFCYALAKPLIAINTLEIMVHAAKKQHLASDLLYCPMLDARRMEVFTALYRNDNKTLIHPQAVILDEYFLKESLAKSRIVFFGNGSSKLKPIMQHENSSFIEIKANAKNLAELAHIAYNNSNFTDVIYSQPNYFKAFHTNIQ